MSFAEWLGIRTFDDPEIEKIVAASGIWANALQAEKSPRWLTFCGPAGNGKTHCAKRLFLWAVRRFSWMHCEYEADPIYWPSFVQQLRAGSAFEKREDMKLWPVLFLDDVGAERDTTGFATEELNTLLGCRSGKWTLLTANLTLEQFAAVDGRIASRLIRDENRIVLCNAQDFALRNSADGGTHDVR